MGPALVQEIEDDSKSSKTLVLTPVESTLRVLLLDVAKYIEENPSPPSSESHVKLPRELDDQPIVLRFTGGWVRDKLLGVGSHDIDVAINKMTGYQFGLRLKEYLDIAGNLEKYGLEGVAATEKQSQKAGGVGKSKIVGGLHKIEANPEKSKHLETVTTKILGLDVDLVNLRKETYTDESRNPQMEFGTPEEDSLRRDATVNAMFYNLNTEEVEDFTNKGLDDLRNKIIRTPLEPYQTFKDDPLRVLRLIRFASRLDYTIDPPALIAMRDPDIQDALRRKISRERVGVELEKALKGPNPHEALRLVFSLNLYETVFSDPSVAAKQHYKPDTDGWQILIDTLKDIIDEGSTLSELVIRDDEEQYMAWLLAALVPYRDAPQPDPPAPGRKLPPPISVSVAREGIKATNKISEIIMAAVRNQYEISRMVEKLHEQKRRPQKYPDSEDAQGRDVLGMAIRRWGACWRSQVIYAFLVDIVEHPGSTRGTCVPFEGWDQILTWAPATAARYTDFLEHLKDLDLLEVCSLKPLLDGKALAKALDTPPGPWMKDALDVVMAWQLRNPAAANAEEAIEQVRAKRGELTSALVRHFLKLTIRPLFIKTRPVQVTEQGRKITTPILPQKMTAQSVEESVQKPWKTSKDAYVLDLLQWIANTLEANLVEDIWSTIVPPVLTLIDDWEAKYKKIGAELLRLLLDATPPSLLERTGLGEVFEGALMPCLNYIPSITSEDESVMLLSAVYPAILSLSKVRYPKQPPVDSKVAAGERNRQRIKFLDSVVRRGIINCYSMCSQYPRITSLLFEQLSTLLQELALDSVKHLRFVLPILNEALSHPLGDAAPSNLIKATEAMQAVILSCWPRMNEHQGEVLKGITKCWLNVEAKDGDMINELKCRLRTAVGMLRSAVEVEEKFDADCAVLTEADGRLKGLLKP